MNSGIDMVMLSSRKLHDQYVEGMKLALKNTTITMDRLNDAVARIVAVKLALGVAKLKPKGHVREQPHHQHIKDRLIEIESATTEYEDSLQAVH